jgi:hypothetical protein
VPEAGRIGLGIESLHDDGVNVILVSSDHAFPFGLTRKDIGFNLNNFICFLYGVYQMDLLGRLHDCSSQG